MPGFGIKIDRFIGQSDIHERIMDVKHPEMVPVKFEQPKMVRQSTYRIKLTPELREKIQNSSPSEWVSILKPYIKILKEDQNV